MIKRTQINAAKILYKYRGPLRIESLEEYLIAKGITTREETQRLSDDELNEYFHKVVHEKKLEEDAKKFCSDWCKLNR